MDVVIRGRNCEVPEGVRTVVHEKVARLARFLDGMDHAEVHFFEERNPRIADREVCEVTMQGHGHYIRAKAASPDVLSAVDRVVGKLEHQMEKLKGKRIGRAHPRRHASVDSVPNLDESDTEAATDRPARIVKTKQFPIKPMTPEEAALQMDLLSHDFFFFTNAESDRAAVVYRRHDGDIGLIDAR